MYMFMYLCAAHLTLNCTLRKTVTAAFSFSSGLCAGLFTSSELLVMSSKLQRGKMKKTTDGAQQAFARSVRKNLHVVVTWDLETKSCSIFKMADRGILEESSRAVFASLCQTCSHVDHYLPWSKQAYSEVALQCWQGASQPKWQDWADTSKIPGYHTSLR